MKSCVRVALVQEHGLARRPRRSRAARRRPRAAPRAARSRGNNPARIRRPPPPAAARSSSRSSLAPRRLEVARHDADARRRCSTTRARMRRGERRRRARAREIRAGHDLAASRRRRRRAPMHRVQVRGEARVGQIRPDVDQFVAQEPPPRCDIFDSYRTRGARGRSRVRCGQCEVWRALPLSLAATLGCAQEGGDLQAQILYAYQTEDTNQLANLMQNLGNQVKAGGADAALRYHLAHARYRFGLLAQGRRAARSRARIRGLRRSAEAGARTRCQIGGGARRCSRPVTRELAKRRTSRPCCCGPGRTSG